MNANGIVVAMVLAAGLGTSGRGRARPSLTHAELNELRKSGNRTAPEQVQQSLIQRAAEKRARRAARRLACTT